MGRPARPLSALSDLPCRYQRWVREGLFERILEALATDLKERGGLDLSECFIDGTFIVAKEGADAWVRPSGAKARIAHGRRQAGRPLRRYKRRWRIERLFAWLGNFRRLVVRYERSALNYLGFVQLGCILILPRQGVRDHAQHCQEP